MSATVGLDSLIDPLTECLDTESARRLLEFRISPRVQERMEELGNRANEGVLTDDERSEYEALINATDFISLLKLKARRQFESAVQ
jgi:hypothetical protein